MKKNLERCIVRRFWCWCRRTRKVERAVHMVEAFGHISVELLFVPHMDLVRELLEDPGTPNDVVIQVLSWLEKAPVSALEPHMGTFVRLLEGMGA